ncbi:hypothetical protein HDV62DRAFT_364085 [Trichoderma sp. SZMC 28011]
MSSNVLGGRWFFWIFVSVESFFVLFFFQHTQFLERSFFVFYWIFLGMYLKRSGIDQDRSSGVERGTLQCLDQRKLKMYKE